MTQEVFGAAATIGQARVVAVTKITSAMFNFVAQVYLARYLNIEDYAVFTLFIASGSLLVLLSMYGIDRVAYRIVPPLRMQKQRRELIVFFCFTLFWRLVQIGLGALLIWVVFLAILPQALLLQLSPVVIQLSAFVLAMSMSDSLSVYCNSVGKQGAQGKALLLAGLVRSTAVIALLVHADTTPLASVLWVFVSAEFALVLLLLGILLVDLGKQDGKSVKMPLANGFQFTDLLTEGGTTQLSYLLRIPFSGPFLRLLVGSFAPPVITAAYGFFQTLADRLYQFMPPILFKGVIEPSLSADFVVHQNVDRIAIVVSVLLKLSLSVTAFLLALTLVLGQPLVDWATNGKYGSEIWIACLVCLHLVSQLVGEVLWIALNPVGRVVVLNRIWYGATFFAGLGLAAAYKLQSTWLVFVVAPIPYFVVAFWLRFVRREPMLIHGLGAGAVFWLVIPVFVSTAAGWLCLFLWGQTALGFCLAILSTTIAFGFVLRMVRIFADEEMHLTGHFSPALSRFVKPFARGK